MPILHINKIATKKEDYKVQYIIYKSCLSWKRNPYKSKISLKTGKTHIQYFGQAFQSKSSFGFNPGFMFLSWFLGSYPAYLVLDPGLNYDLGSNLFLSRFRN